MDLLLILTYKFHILSKNFGLRFTLTDVSSVDFTLVVAVTVAVPFPYRDSIPGNKTINFILLFFI